MQSSANHVSEIVRKSREHPSLQKMPLANFLKSAEQPKAHWNASGGIHGVIPMACFSDVLPARALAFLAQQKSEKLRIGDRLCRTPFRMRQ
jgi:hypothetical protein